MIGIPIFDKHADDFSTHGIGLLIPHECTIEEIHGGMYELTLIHPMDDMGKWERIQVGRIIKAPSPVREVPIFEGEITTGTVTRDIYRVTGTSTGVRLRTGPGTSYSRISTHKNNTMVIKLTDYEDDDWMHVQLVDGGATGYMSTEYLTLDHSEVETIVDGVGQGVISITPARDQLFRIYCVETDTAQSIVTARATHIFYDYGGDIINADYTPKNADIADVIANINSKLMLRNEESSEQTQINIVPINLTGRISGEYGWRSPVDVYLNETDGIISQLDALIVRDNYNAYILPGSTVYDRGVTIRRGKNLVGVTTTLDDANVVTRVIPVGKDEEGNPLYIYGTINYVQRADVDIAFVPDYTKEVVQRIEYDVSVGDSSEDDSGTVFDTEREAQAELENLGYNEFLINNIDRPIFEMEVDFVLLSNTEEFKEWTKYNTVHMYDTVTVIDESIGLNQKARVSGYVWNVLTEQYDSITVSAKLEAPTSAVDNSWKAKPTNIKFSQSNDEKQIVVLTWNHVANDLQYVVIENNVGSYTKAGVKGITFEGVEPGTHTYSIAAVKDGSPGNFEDITVEVADNRWMAAPTDVVATAEGTTVTISWKHLESNDLLYYVYDNGNSIGVAQSGTNTGGNYSITRTGVADGEHTYSVTVIKDGVRGGTGFASPIMVNAEEWKAAPTNLAVQDYGGGDIIISWEHVSDDVAYEIAENGTVLKQTSVGQKMTALSNQAYGSHTYEVYAVKDGDRGTGATVTVEIGDESWKIAPVVTASFVTTQMGGGGAYGSDVKISWTYDGDASEFALSDNGKELQTVSGVSEYTIQLPTFGEHNYEVRAIKNGEYGNSGAAIVTIQFGYEITPTNLRASQTGAAAFRLIWYHPGGLYTKFAVQMDATRVGTVYPTGGSQHSYDLTDVTSGTHTIYVWAEPEDNASAEMSGIATTTITV